MDALIGAALGYKDIRSAFTYWCPDGPLYFDEQNEDNDLEPCLVFTNVEHDDMEGLPPFSTAIGAAWEVIGYMGTEDYKASVEQVLDFNDGSYPWRCQFWCKNILRPSSEAHAETAELAICRAALINTLT